MNKRFLLTVTLFHCKSAASSYFFHIHYIYYLYMRLYMWCVRAVRTAVLPLAAGLIIIASLAFVQSAGAYNSVSSGGLELQLTVDPEEPVEGEAVELTVRVRDSLQGKPLHKVKVMLSTDILLSTVKQKGAALHDFEGSKQAVEAGEFGEYVLSTVFKTSESHYVKVSVLQVGEKTLEVPVRAGFIINVKPRLNRARSGSVVILILLMMSASAAYVILRVKKLPSTDPAGFNFLDIPWLKRFFKWKHLQTVFQVPMLIIFFGLIILALVGIQDGGKNVSTKLIWTIWWAGIIFTFVLVGRLWCFMCPVGALADWTSRLAKPKRRIPARFRNVWLANFAFVMLTWLDVQLGIVRSPLVTGFLFVAIILIATGTAMIYERRTFCRYLCPIGGVIGLYSMFSGVELRAKDCTTCSGHKIKECYVGGAEGRGCPMFEMPSKMDSNNACNFCGECVKSCPNDNITLRLRGFFKDAWTTSRHRVDEATLAIVIVGVSIFVTGDMLKPWEGWMNSAIEAFPADVFGIEYWYTRAVLTKSTLYFGISLMLIPGMLVLASYMSNRLVAEDDRLGVVRTFTIFGYMFIPVGLSMHLAHNLGHLFKESGGIVPAVQMAVNKYTPYFIGEPDWRMAVTPLIDASFLYWLQMGTFVFFYSYAIYSGHRLSLNAFSNRTSALRGYMPMLALSLVFMIVNVYLLNLPMAPRHIH